MSVKSSRHTKQATRSGASSATALAQTAIAAGADPVLFGDQTVEAAADNNSSGLAEAFPFANSTNGTTASISVYVDSGSAASKLIAGVYTNNSGHPGALVASGSLSSPKSAAWNNVSIASTAVSSGKTYWVAVLGTGGTFKFRDRSSGPCTSENSRQYTLTSLPGSWTSGPSYTTCPISAYVNGYLTSGSSTTTTTTTTPTTTTPTTTTTTTTPTTTTTTTTPTTTTTTTTVAPPSNMAPPTVSGSTVQGQALSTSKGSWSGSLSSYAYQWKQCDGSGNGCTTITNATSSSYMLTAGDVGHTLRAVVSASNTGGVTPATSTQTAAVSAPPPAAPSNTALPVISGSTVQGQALSTSSGSWSGGPSYSYQWKQCDGSGNSCTTIANATSSSYTLTAGDVGSTIRSVVTATNAGGSTSATSAATAAVTAPAPAAPTNTTAPAVSGTATQGHTLAVSNGTWNGSPTSYAYQWRRCDSSGGNCTNISNATASSYTLASGDVGSTISSVVTATNAGGSTSATSPVTAVVASSASSGSCPSSTTNTPDGPDPSGGCFPGPATTGVPAGTVLTNYTGSCTITAPNTVIDSKIVNCGALIIQAANVQIRNSQINGYPFIDNEANSYSFSVTDSTISNPSAAQNTESVGKSHFTVTRSNISGGRRGVWCEYDCSVTDSYVHGQQHGVLNCNTPGCAWHEAGIRQGSGNGTTTGVQVIRHNTVACDAPDVAANDPNAPGDTSGCSADLTGYGDFAPIQYNTVDRNLFLATPGGTCAYGGSSGSNGSKPYGNAANHDVFTSNVFQRKSSIQSSGHCGNWFGISDFSTGAPGNQWAGNHWDDGTVMASDG